MRWFVEEIGPVTVVSRVDVGARVFEFTCDGGATWQHGDRSLGYRNQGDLTVREVAEADARALLTAA